MTNKNLTLAVSVLVLFAASTALAAPSGRTFSLPSNAKEVAPGVFDLGTAVIDGKEVQGYAFIHYKNGLSRASQNARAGGTGSCYAFIAKGAKWKAVEDWAVNPANSRGLDGTFVLNNLAADIQKWESAAGKNIMGTGSATTNALSGGLNNVNEVYFADVATPGAIAVTTVWGFFSGPTFQRELVEWDQVYDDTDYDWSDSSVNGVSGKMDFENIATHELGHSFGMGHPNDSCTEETMYRFAGFGETKKRDLNSGDTKGVAQLYA